MGCFQRVQQWWQVRKEKKRAQKKARKAARAEAKAARAAAQAEENRNNADEIPVSALAPTQRKFTGGGLALTYELAPARSPFPRRLTPFMDPEKERAVMAHRRKAFDVHFGTSSSDSRVGQLHDMDAQVDDNLRELDARNRRSRRVDKFVKIVKRGSKIAPHSVAGATDAAAADAGGVGAGKGAHLGGSLSQ